ncbi:hypothetical protein [Arthrobacter sp.]|uniref:hypothetical protein n=1 Tax=Arthrobacter sp. TaxID=1667 RepID=UPI003A9168E2
MDARRPPAANPFLTGALTLLAGLAIRWVGPLIPSSDGGEGSSVTAVLIGLTLILVGAVVLIVATYRVIASIDFPANQSGAGDRTEQPGHPRA